MTTFFSPKPFCKSLFVHWTFSCLYSKTVSLFLQQPSFQLFLKNLFVFFDHKRLDCPIEFFSFYLGTRSIASILFDRRLSFFSYFHYAFFLSEIDSFFSKLIYAFENLSSLRFVSCSLLTDLLSRTSKQKQPLFQMPQTSNLFRIKLQLEKIHQRFGDVRFYVRTSSFLSLKCIRCKIFDSLNSIYGRLYISWASYRTLSMTGQSFLGVPN